MLTAHVHHVQQQWGANGFKYVFFTSWWFQFFCFNHTNGMITPLAVMFLMQLHQNGGASIPFAHVARCGNEPALPLYQSCIDPG